MKPIEAIQKGFKVIEAFSTKNPRLRLPEITRRTGLPKATVYRILRTMSSIDYIRFDPSTNEFMLGLKLMSLGLTARSGLDLRGAALPYLESLFKKIDQTVNLGILDGTDVVYIERLKKQKIVNLDLNAGSRLDAYRSSIGLAILAYLDTDEYAEFVTEILKDSHAASIIGRDGKQLEKRIREVRLRGFAMNDGQYFKDLRAVSAPVFNAEKKVKGAVNIAVFKQHCNKKKLLEELAPQLLETTAAISKAIGFSGNI